MLRSSRAVILLLLAVLVIYAIVYLASRSAISVALGTATPPGTDPSAPAILQATSTPRALPTALNSATAPPVPSLQPGSPTLEGTPLGSRPGGLASMSPGS